MSIEAFWQDLRYSARMLVNRPGLAAAAVLALALGCGANTAVFTLVNAVFLRPLPMREPERLVAIYGSDQEDGGYNRMSYLNYLDYRERVHAFTGILAYQGFGIGLSEGDGGGRPERVTGRAVSGNYFEVLGVEAALGRTFRMDEDAAPGAHPVAVIGDGLWHRRFGGDPGVVGRRVLLNGHPFTILGVLPGGFNDLERTRAADLWVPLAMSDQVSPYAGNLDKRNVAMFFLVGRLRPGTSFEQARSEMLATASALQKDFPDDNKGESVALLPLAEGAIGPDQRDVFLHAGELLLGAVALILLVACTTVANLLVARAQSRGGEIALRLSLGVSRGRLVRQLVLESLLLFLAGGLLGLPLGAWGLHALWTRFRPPQIHEGALHLELDPRVLLLTFLVALVTGLVFGLAPALQVSRPDLTTLLRGASGGSTATGERRGRLGIRGALVLAQIGLSIVALTGAGLFLRSLGQARQIDPGFEAGKLVLVSFDLGAAGYDEARGREAQRAAVERVANLPGVASASLAQVPPLKNVIHRKKIAVFGAESDDEGPLIRTNAVGAGYFETVGIPVPQGRGFKDSDREDAPQVAVVNETLARSAWPGKNPVGERFRYVEEDGSVWVEVVGVARDARYETIGEEPVPYIYVPLAQRYSPTVTLHVRSAGGDTGALLPAVQARLQELDRDLPLYDARTASELLTTALWGPRMAASLLTLFAVLAVVLTALGVYGLMAYLAGERRQEIGIRLVLGAGRKDILARFLGRAAVLVAAGTVLGAAAAFVLTRVVASLLYGLSAADPVAFLGAPAVLLAVALAASVVPVFRALRGDPFSALRRS
jgi:predicted permease